MSRAIVVAFHKYTPFGDEYYEPLLDSFLRSMEKYRDEYDKVYLLDSNWKIDSKKIEGLEAEIIVTDPQLRYYDAYKSVLPQIKEDLVMFMDNDMVVYRAGVIDAAFGILVEAPEYPQAVVSIFDTIGEYQTIKMNGKNKFCPYWFVASKDLLMKYRDVYWGSDMPKHETLGKLTEVMLNDGVEPIEWEEDKGGYMFDGKVMAGDEKGKDLGYYHVRAGSTPAYLLATHKYGDAKTYWDYINNQPKIELLRQCAWYEYMLDDVSPALLLMLIDMKVSAEDFYLYYHKFKKCHGLS